MKNKLLNKSNSVVVELENVSLGYLKSNILEKVNMQAIKGSITAIIGLNGSGKSTILNAISGFIKAKGGSIRVGNSEISRLTVEQIVRKKKLGYLHQKKRNFPDLTVEENLYLACFNARWCNRRKRILEILEESPFNKIKESLSYHANTLSGGVKLILALAIIKLQENEIILLDEPVAELDDKNTSDIRQELSILKNQNKTIILVEQCLSFVFKCSDYVYIIEELKELGKSQKGPSLCTLNLLDINREKSIKKILNLNSSNNLSNEISRVLWP